MEAAMMGAGSAAPERSLTQRMDALRHANAIRSWRRVLKADLKQGRKTLADLIALLEEPPEEMLTMKVWDALIAVPKVGKVKANRAITALRIAPSKTVGGLTGRQRGELTGWLRTRGV